MTVPPPLPTIPYQTPRLLDVGDRSTTLQVVGILFILGGALCGCMTAMTPLSLVAPRPAGVPAQRVSVIVTAVVMYGVIAGVLITLGIGCMRKRRWTRPIILVLGWIGLVAGVIGMIIWTVTAPQMGQAMRAAIPAGAGTPPPPPAFITTMIVVMSVFMAVIYVIIPAVLVFLFRGDDVRVTLEHYDPAPRWTDGKPLPVLAICALLVLAALGVLMSVLQGWLALFGVILTGAAAIVVGLLVVLVFATAAYLAFRRTPLGWTLALALFVIMPIGYGVTLLRHDVIDLYRASGMDESQLAMMSKFRAMTSPVAAVPIGIAALAAVVFTIRARRHFVVESATEP